jgi:hypothetical protein
VIRVPLMQGFPLRMAGFTAMCCSHSIMRILPPWTHAFGGQLSPPWFVHVGNGRTGYAIVVMTKPCSRNVLGGNHCGWRGRLLRPAGAQQSDHKLRSPSSAGA